MWVVPGSYNIPENGYASMTPFFSLIPFLLLLLIPSLSMRSFAEEKRMHTLLLLKSRPIRLTDIITAKILAIFLTVIIALIPTVLYVISIYNMGSPIGNLDLGIIIASYAGLLFLILGFVSISVFSSAITSNQMVALIIGLLLCAFFYMGFDLIATMISSGKGQVLVRDFGFLSHYQSVQRGLILSSDLLYMLSISVLFYFFTLIVLGQSVKSVSVKSTGILFLLLAVLGFMSNIRIDSSSDRRYTISHPTQKILKEVDAPIEVELYLDGRLNPGFIRLQNATLELLNDYSKLTSGLLQYKITNPYEVDNKNFVELLNDQGFRGIAVNERDAAGKMSQHIIFPWAKITYNDKEIPVSLLVNQQGRSGEENLNASIEMLEYQFSRAIQLLIHNNDKRIVFIEGHGELTEEELSDISDHLSLEYTIDRGVMSGNPGEMNAYSLVIIAGPQLPFSENEKYVLDQYVMQGGKILWLINGVQLQSLEALAERGETISMANNVNLDDILFNYGVRVNPVLLQDIQCLEIPVNTVIDSSEPVFIPKPWSFAPLLLPNQDNPVTKGLPLVKTEFASTLSMVGTTTDNIRKNILLTSSQHAHIAPVPETVTLKEVERQPDEQYFNESYLPIAVLMEGVFNSVFQNRVLPINSQSSNTSFLPESKSTKMIVIASEEVIRNEVVESEKGIQILPLGYDRYSQIKFGNREFILSAVNYLTDDTGLASLRNKSLQLHLLDKHKVSQNRNLLVFMNVILPPFLVILLFLILLFNRQKKYKRMAWR